MSIIHKISVLLRCVMHGTSEELYSSFSVFKLGGTFSLKKYLLAIACKKGRRITETFYSSYNEDKKKLLIVTHELSFTGAPLAMKNAIQILKNYYNVSILSPIDGPLREEIENMRIVVNVSPSHCYVKKKISDIAKEFDFIYVNTADMYCFINALRDTEQPIFWWIHEGMVSFYHYGRGFLKNIGEHCQVYSVSEYSKRIIMQVLSCSEPKILHYGLNDGWKSLNENDFETGKVIFIIVGTICERKGQDVFLDAISLLDPNIRKQGKFKMIGTPLENHKDYFNNCMEKARKLGVEYLGAKSAGEMPIEYLKANVVVAPSRDDPLPMSMSEGMMFSRVCICSDNTGTAALLKDGYDGFVIPSGDAQALAQVIKKIITNKQIIKSIGQRSRKIYEKNFQMDTFFNNLTDVFKILESSESEYDA